MAQETVTKNLRDGTITIKDGDSNTVTVVVEEGNLSFTVTKNRVEVLDRGVLSHLRDGDEAPVELSFGAKFTEWTASGSNDPTIADAFQQVGGASGWTSTNSDNGGVYTVDVDFAIADPDGSTETIAFTTVYHTSLRFSEGADNNTVEVEARAFMTKPTSSHSGS